MTQETEHFNRARDNRAKWTDEWNSDGELVIDIEERW